MKQFFLVLICVFFSLISCSQDCSEYISYYRNSKGKVDTNRVLEKGKYCNGNKKEGPWISFDRFGNKTVENFTSGLRDGIRCSYNDVELDTNQLLSFGHDLIEKFRTQDNWRFIQVFAQFKDGHLHGERVSFSKGRIASYIKYDQGRAIDSYSYNSYNPEAYVIDTTSLPIGVMATLHTIPNYQTLIKCSLDEFRTVVKFGNGRLVDWQFPRSGKLISLAYNDRVKANAFENSQDSVASFVTQFHNWKQLTGVRIKDSNNTFLRTLEFRNGHLYLDMRYANGGTEVREWKYDYNGRLRSFNEKLNGKYVNRHIGYSHNGEKNYISYITYYTSGEADSSLGFNDQGNIVRKNFFSPNANYNYDDKGTLASYKLYYPAELGGRLKEDLYVDGTLRTFELIKKKSNHEYVQTMQHGYDCVYKNGHSQRELVERRKYRKDKLVWTEYLNENGEAEREWAPGFGRQPGLTIGFRGCGVCLGNPHRCNGIRLSLIDNKPYDKRINGLNMVLFRSKKARQTTFVNGLSLELITCGGGVNGNTLAFTGIGFGKRYFQLPGMYVTSTSAKMTLSVQSFSTYSGIASVGFNTWIGNGYSVGVAPIFFNGSRWNRPFVAAISTNNWKNRNRGKIRSGIKLGLVNLERKVVSNDSLEKKKLKMMEKQYKWMTPDSFSPNSRKSRKSEK